MKKLLPILLLTLPLLSACSMKNDTSEVKDCKGSLQCIIDSISEDCMPITAHLLSRGTSGNNQNVLQILSISLRNEPGKCILRQELITNVVANCDTISSEGDDTHIATRDACHKKNKEQKNIITECPIEDTRTLKKFFEKSMDEDGLYQFELAQNEFSPTAGGLCSQYESTNI